MLFPHKGFFWKRSSQSLWSQKLRVIWLRSFFSNNQTLLQVHLEQIPLMPRDRMQTADTTLRWENHLLLDKIHFTKMKTQKLKLLRYCMFLCHIEWNLNTVSQFRLYPRTLYWRFRRFVEGSRSQCNSQALATPWRFLNEQTILPARK